MIRDGQSLGTDSEGFSAAKAVARGDEGRDSRCALALVVLISLATIAAAASASVADAASPMPAQIAALR